MRGPVKKQKKKKKKKRKKKKKKKKEPGTNWTKMKAYTKKKSKMTKQGMGIKMRIGATAKREGQAEEGLVEEQAGSECK